MSREQVTKFTCNRCGKKASASDGSYPPDWECLRDEFIVESYDLCPKCYESFIAWKGGKRDE